MSAVIRGANAWVRKGRGQEIKGIVGTKKEEIWGRAKLE